MARIRSIKIGFFQNDTLSLMPASTRLLFCGLWVLADREGRLEDRPGRIWAELFPYEPQLLHEMEGHMAALAGAGFIHRYAVGTKKFVQISNWNRHQIPQRSEAPSEIPEPSGELTLYDRPPNETGRFRVYERDGFKCVYCGLDMTNSARQRCVDHVIPHSRGGTHRDKNLVTSCKKCNAKKSDKTPDEAGLLWPADRGETYSGKPIRKQRRPHRDRPLTHGETDHQPPVNGGVNGSSAVLGLVVGSQVVGSQEKGVGGYAPVSSELEKLLDSIGLSNYQRVSWFKGATLEGDLMLVDRPGAVEWIDRHYLPSLSEAAGRALRVMARGQAVSA